MSSLNATPTVANFTNNGPIETMPLIKNIEKPPLAKLESLDEKDDRETVTEAYPGVDDGFFNGNTDNEPIPDISSRAGTDETDGRTTVTMNPTSPQPGSNKPTFPYAPGYGHDFELGSIPDVEGSIPDVNVYQHKKTLAQGMMDLALFSANANQLRYVVESYRRHPYYYPSVILISFSLILQVAIGIGLIWNATYNVKDKKEICIANKISNFTIIGIFLVTVINVFISAFGVADIDES